MGVALRIAVLVIAWAVIATACAPAKLVGDPLPGALAPDFTLTDGPTGETVTLSSLGGRVVLLTFLYTSCVDTCPLTAETIRGARDRLGDAAKSVTLIAVSVDPQGDTPTTTRQFVIDHRLEGSLRYLIGSQATLARVWQAYGIAQAVSTRDVLHSDVVYLIDKHGRGRLLLHSTVTPDVLASDLSLLANER
ncbi:MAG: SCO family protein [Actinomycetota bacterium]|nr:SCO family protein [Actinomycetota bacterium]